MKLTFAREDMRFTLSTLSIVLVAFAALLYLVISCLWGFMAFLVKYHASSVNPPEWSYFWRAVPAPLLCGLFVVALVLRKRKFVFRGLVAVAVGIMIVGSLYDCLNQNYQVATHSMEHGLGNYHVLGKGAEHMYLNWPWLTDLEPWIMRLKTSPNKTSEGIRQPADSLSKPSM